jgi:uncharacterized membrane protein YgcG
VATGEPFTLDERDRLQRAVHSAQEQTGMRFSVRVGDVRADPAIEAERLLANLADGPRDPAVLLQVAPGERHVEVLTTAAARRRISDQAAGLAVLTMTSSFTVGDLVGGIVNGLRQLADSAGRTGGTQGAPDEGARRLSGRAADGADPNDPTGTAGGGAGSGLHKVT